MRYYNKISRGICVLALLIAAGQMLLCAQQIPRSQQSFWQPGIGNPGGEATGLNRIAAAYQERKAGLRDVRSRARLLNYQSANTGHSKRFSWGVGISQNQEHTESRLAIMPIFGAKIVDSKTLDWNLGIGVGMINWYSKYDDVQIFDRKDPVTGQISNLVELDVAAGTELSLDSKKIQGKLGAVINQIPGNLASENLQGITLYPQYRAYLAFAAEIAHNILIGPQAAYHNLLADSESGFKSATMDLGLKASFPRQGFWIGSGYRINQTALLASAGIRLLESDSVYSKRPYGTRISAQFSYLHPMESTQPFGPTAELGLVIDFGSKRRYVVRDTMRSAKNFWENEAFLNEHKLIYLTPGGPSSLKAHSTVGAKYVTLRYDFADDHFRYIGELPEFDPQGALADIGEEWPGVDDLLVNQFDVVIRHALRPLTTNIKDPENLEPLKSLLSIEFSAMLKTDEIGAQMGANGIRYEGEFSRGEDAKDTLFLPVVFNEADTVLAIQKGRYINNLELAALKLFSMQRKAEHELELEFGDEYYGIHEGEQIDFEEVGGRKLVTFRKLRIVPDNPNQKAFQRNGVELRFLRDVNAMEAKSHAKRKVKTRNKAK